MESNEVIMAWLAVDRKGYKSEPVENRTNSVTITNGGNELFTITAKGELLEEIKEEIKK